MQWTACPPAPLAWFSLRDALFSLLRTPALLVPLEPVARRSPSTVPQTPLNLPRSQ
jgi:hypothetical protein